MTLLVSAQGPESLSCHAELVSASHLNFGFELTFELWHLTFYVFGLAPGLEDGTS